MARTGSWRTRLIPIGVVFMAGALLCGCSLSPDGFELNIGPEQIQQKLASRFPIEDCLAGALCVGAQQPQVVLAEGSDRIGLQVQLTRRIGSGERTPMGQAQASAKLRFEGSTASVYLHDVQLNDFAISGMPAVVNDALKTLARRALLNSLGSQPVYQLKADTLTEKLQRATVSDIRVRDGKLRVVMGFAKT